MTTRMTKKDERNNATVVALKKKKKQKRIAKTRQDKTHIEEMDG